MIKTLGNQLTLVFICVASALAAEPPKLTATSPAFWGVGISPGKQVIRLTFDRRMAAGYTAWMGPSSIVPNSTSDTKMSADRVTFSIEAELQPAKVYVFGLNEEGIPGVGFQSLQGVSLRPHFLVFQTAGTPAPDDTPPQVVRSVPGNGDRQVDPARTKAIVLSFDKPMQTAKQGLHLFENNTAIDISKARLGYSADGRTFTLYYDFKASTPYRMELNSVTDIGFASAKRVPLWPVQIAFTTGQPH